MNKNILEHFKKFPELEILSFENLKCSTKGIKSLSKLTKLRKINGIRVQDIFPGYVTALEPLQKLKYLEKLTLKLGGFYCYDGKFERLHQLLPCVDIQTVQVWRNRLSYGF